MFTLRQVMAGRADPTQAVYVCVFGAAAVMVGLLALSGTVQWLAGTALVENRRALLLAGPYLVVAATGAWRCFKADRRSSGTL